MDKSPKNGGPGAHPTTPHTLDAKQGRAKLNVPLQAEKELLEQKLTNNDTAVRDFAALHLQPKSTAAADNEDIENAGRTASGQGRSTSITPGPGKPNDQIPYPLVRAPGVALPKDRPLTPIEIKTLRLCAQLRAQRAEHFRQQELEMARERQPWGGHGEHSLLWLPSPVVPQVLDEATLHIAMHMRCQGDWMHRMPHKNKETGQVRLAANANESMADNKDDDEKRTLGTASLCRGRGMRPLP
ncbi:uncharacterized protein E0L32_008214 [Thyridium curvatum]|uniref:Uncharacterized protein n=1 Tax=Thyridium curvatum TaxID=1093900 RepID=A0A507AK68_9PEZI|nr:uncharacterized protein E0L32_008214 [Thyridium curvatum]TPX10825.1 hypothetical protein E0L32_008214 [Thyridium curvatum]